MFDQIAQVWGYPEVDLLASQQNKKVERYISWKWEATALGTDALRYNWMTWALVYAYPEPALIGRIIRRLRGSETELILVAPLWKSQPWYSMILEMLIDFPRKLEGGEELVRDQEGKPHPLHLKGALNLVAWKLSGETYKREAFLNQLSKWWRINGKSPQKPHMNLAGTAGYPGVERDTKIPILPL